MKLSLTAAALFGAITAVNAQKGAWEQCGGQGYTGATSCVSGYSCVKQDQWWSSCQPGSSGGGSSGGGSSGGGSGSTITCPGNSGNGCGKYTVSGLGSNKQKVLNNGGNVQDLAFAMLETEKMDTNYAYGDNKSNDAANFGIFKQNWGMLRVSCNKFKGQTTSQYNNGAALNTDIAADIKCRKEGIAYYGYQKWVAGHRNGASGLSNPNTNDINLFMKAAEWTEQQLNSNSAYRTDDTRFWVDVVAI